ncbi:hypothetical protein, partial [Klebsiella oxytoca]|uniref:hypothetical protein n=3 Tax=Klebsiella TaxID=570 RepID=UPI001C8E518D
LTALSAEFTIGEGELMAHDVPLGCAPDEYDDLISGTCSHLPYRPFVSSYHFPKRVKYFSFTQHIKKGMCFHVYFPFLF